MTGSRVRIPALQVGPGDLPMVQAQALLLEKITAANCARARQRADDDGWHNSIAPTTTSRGVIFPGQDGSIGLRQVVLVSGSFGARMSATELGNYLAGHLNSQLTDGRLRQLVVALWKRADAA